MSAVGVTKGLLALVAAMMLTGCADYQVGADASRSIASPEEAFLWERPYSHVNVEVHHHPHFSPSALALDALSKTVAEATGKTVHVEQPVLLPAWAVEVEEWTREKIQRVIDTVSSAGLADGEWGRRDTAVLHVYYLGGKYVDYDLATTGLEVNGRIFLFEKAHVLENSHRLAPPVNELLERRTVVHEFGHAIGLVNCGIPMVTAREDPESRCHSTNSRSVMGSAMPADEADLYIDGNWPPWKFDDDDWADIAGFRATDPDARAATSPE